MPQKSHYKDAQGRIKEVEYNDQELARGGAGVIYLTTDEASVVKIYFSHSIPNMADLEEILRAAPPPKYNKYLAWPTGIVLDAALQHPVGVIMPNVQKDFWMEQAIRYRSFKGLASLKARSPERVGTLKGRIEAAIGIATAARYLNRIGYGHSDFSGKNVFVNPERGIGVLIDLDGLIVNETHMAPKMWGTEGYAAPELVTGDLKLPDLYSDRHALAVVLYELLLQGHPLKGRRSGLHADPKEDDKLQLGKYALYREHSTDTSNRPSNSNRPTADMLGKPMMDLFRYAFEHGIVYEPSRRGPRPHAERFETELEALKFDLVKCSNSTCFWGYFPSKGGTVEHCPACGTKSPEVLQGWVSVIQADTGKGGWYPLKSARTYKLLRDCKLTGDQIFAGGDALPIIQLKPTTGEEFECHVLNTGLICELVEPSGLVRILDGKQAHLIKANALLRLSHMMSGDLTLLRVAKGQVIPW